MRYREIVADVKGDMGHQVWYEEDLGRLKRRIKKLKRMLVEEFEESCNSGLHTLKHTLRDQTVEDLQIYVTNICFVQRPIPAFYCAH